MIEEAKPLVLTMGEPAGVGPELTLKAWQAHLRGEAPRFFVVGDPSVYVSAATKVATISHPSQTTSTGEALPVLFEGLRTPSNIGEPSSENAQTVIRSIERGVQSVLSGDAAALVTNPIAKATLYDAGFMYQGHTDFLAALARRGSDGSPTQSVMMLMARDLRVVLITEHLSIANAAKALSVDAIVAKGRIAANALRSDFGIGNPRLAVAALNPHAGEGGAMGDEENITIKPAVEILRKEGILATGPLPADTLFHEEARQRFDAVLCMYHDQGLIPVKMLDFWAGVNVTLGLPFVRTSPDHGVAFDIAGKGVARVDSLLAALRAACDIAQRRAQQ